MPLLSRIGGQNPIARHLSGKGRVTINLAISANTSNYSIWANKGATYEAGNTDVTLTITGAYTVSASGGNPALDTGSGWSVGDTLSLVNTAGGVVQGQAGTNGAGGAGGAGSTISNVNGSAGSPGSPAVGGGIALKAQFALSVTNGGGTLAGGSASTGGGGGNGGGGSTHGVIDCCGSCMMNELIAGATGANGSTGSGVSGSAGAAGTGCVPSAGGAGGAPGANGAVGNYINGNSYVTWVSTGTRTGSVV